MRFGADAGKVADLQQNTRLHEVLGHGIDDPGFDPAIRPMKWSDERVGDVVVVRYFAAARAAAGLPSENVDVGDGATVADAIEAITSRHGEALRRVLTACSFLLDSVAVRDRATPLRPGAQLDILPPFAGG
jgi:sulfur-carrier protein